ncbi:MAG: 30S ribosomal protein S8 [Nitrososphaeraceae archaeon]|nr:30S ribosomal protein S8 [Nitrososphaeraceae archaeon]MDW0136603.1 30S ribosomal protein S8 [Nitrososphaeraceae archaeon]MDW0138198.1 30S ribosomal protein S8 [Nitrososphaeraceae archaeon]MDW0142085.1 30S ribosomal protein S8 [Nitrososphaeraceae archaeon]MDW0144497.1 30S ribosomal protein S8 [Nitrososphaeraceae archaeon]
MNELPALNILSNLFTTLYNNEVRRKKECIVSPSSRFSSEVLRVMQKHRYIGEFEQIDDSRAGKFKIQLLAKINKCGIVTPKFSVRKNQYLNWERQFLPAYNMGILIVSTSKGVMTHHEAQEMGIGGVLVGYVY